MNPHRNDWLPQILALAPVVAAACFSALFQTGCGEKKTAGQPGQRGLVMVDKGRCRGKAISVRGIQKRLEYYGRLARLKVSCHQLRHTMATQLLNADAALVTIQDLLGHSRIKTTQRYCRVSNLKVQRDYHQAMAVVLQRTG